MYGRQRTSLGTVYVVINMETLSIYVPYNFSPSFEYVEDQVKET